MTLLIIVTSICYQNFYYLIWSVGKISFVYSCLRTYTYMDKKELKKVAKKDEDVNKKKAKKLNLFLYN